MFSLTKTGKSFKRININIWLCPIDGRCPSLQASGRSFKWEEKNKKFDYELRDVKLESVQSVKDLAVKIVSNLKLSQQ